MNTIGFVMEVDEDDFSLIVYVTFKMMSIVNLWLE